MILFDEAIYDFFQITNLFLEDLNLRTVKITLFAAEVIVLYN